MPVQVHRLDLYKRKWPKMLVWVLTLDRYEHSSLVQMHPGAAPGQEMTKEVILKVE